MKRGQILLIFLLVIILSAQVAKAQLEDFVDEKREELEGIKTNVTEAKENIESPGYLWKEWEEYFDTTPLGKIMNWIGEHFFQPFSPIFKLILGVEYSLSWIFVFSLGIWIGLFIFLYFPSSAMFSNKILGVIVSAIIASIIGLSGVIKKAVETMALAVSNFWLNLLLIILLLLILIIIGKKIRASIRGEKRVSDKEQMERDKAVIHTQAKVAEKELNPKGKGLGGKRKGIDYITKDITGGD